MKNSSPALSASSSNNSGHRRRDPRSRVAGISLKCWCGATVVEKVSRTDENPFRRYYRCWHAYFRILENDPHVFKWVDEAYRNEIQQLEYEVRKLEEELAKLKSCGNLVVSQNVVIDSNDYVAELFENVEEMLAESRMSMKRMKAMVFGECVLVVVIGIVVMK